MIKNIIINSKDGEFDYQAEGLQVEIVEVFEDGICYIGLNGELITEDCVFNGEHAIINK